MGHPTGSTLTLTDILNASDEAVFVLDADRRFILFNQACERITGWSADEIINQSCRCSEVTHCHDEQGRSLAGLLCPGMAVFQGRAPALRQKMHIRARDGVSRWVETQYTTICDVRGRPQCIIGVMRDHSEAREREQAWRGSVEELHAEIDRIREQQRERFGFAGVLTRAPGMEAVLERMQAACGSHSPVLIIGEAGTGKEHTARTIHQHGPRREKPFVPASAAAFPPQMADRKLFGEGAQGGLFAKANQGTLYLEDIDQLSMGTQLRILRVLQDRVITPPDGGAETLDVRLIAATRRPLHDLLGPGVLRQDLYYRLAAITLELPPLRSRREDIALLARHFLDELNGASARPIQEIEPSVWAALEAHSWPGNVRELYALMEASLAVARDGRLRAQDLQFAPRMPTVSATLGDQIIPLDARLADIEKRTILAAIRKAGGQRNLAARMMGISRSRLYRRMEALGINPDVDA